MIWSSVDFYTTISDSRQHFIDVYVFKFSTLNSGDNVGFARQKIDLKTLH
jgi:hypothetical protein